MNMEGRYSQDQTRLGFLYFHLKCIQNTLSNSVCYTCLLLLLLCLAATLTLLQQQGEGGKRDRKLPWGRG